MKNFNLRPYQKEAIEAIQSEWNNGNKKTLLVAATGTGKTCIFVSLMSENVKKGRRELILAHRGELLDQAIEKIRSMTDIPCALEKADSSAAASDAPIIVGSVQTLMQDKRLEEFPEDSFSDIIVDEAHHITSDSYQKILSHFPNANVLGVTATPDRMDERALADYFDSKAFEYPLIDAVKDGYLCPITINTIRLKIDISDVKQQSGDFAVNDLATVLDPYLEAIADEMIDKCKGRTTLVFTPLIATSKKFEQILKQKTDFRICEINGSDKDRAEKMDNIRAGKYDVILNSVLLTEGVDAPNIDCIINLRATRSRSLFFQMLGRGTRLSPETGKKDLLILDFLWQTKRFNIMHPGTLIAEDEDISQYMFKESWDGEYYDIFDLREKAKRDIVSERESAIAHQLELLRQKKAKAIDPLQFAFSVGSHDILTYMPVYHWENDPITEKQDKALIKLGIDTSNIKTKGQATKLLGIVMDRIRKGYSTPKQIKLLERRGFRNVGRWTMKQASDMISLIADNMWKIPYGIKPAYYIPDK